MLMLKTIMSQIQVGDWFVTVGPEGCLYSHSGHLEAQEVPSVCFWRKGLPVHGSSLWPGLGAEDVHKVHGCCSGPFEATWHSCTQLLGRLAHIGPLQGVSELLPRYRPPPHSCSWPQNEHQKECSHPFLTNCVFGVSFGFRSNAGPSGSCLDFQFQCTFGPLQARPSCLCEHLSQAPRPHGRSLLCATSRGGSILWWMWLLRIRSTGLATRLIRVSRSCFCTLLIWQDPTFLQSGVRIGEIHRCNSHMVTHGHINDRLGRGLWRHTGARCLDKRVPLLAHKLPGAQSRLPGTNSLSPLSKEVSCDSQDGQHGGGIHINRQGGSRSHTPNRLVRHLLLWSRDKFLSLRAVHVRFWTLQTIFCQGSCWCALVLAASLGEGRYFAGLWGAWPSYTSLRSGTVY